MNNPIFGQVHPVTMRSGCVVSGSSVGRQRRPRARTSSCHRAAERQKGRLRHCEQTRPNVAFSFSDVVLLPQDPGMEKPRPKGLIPISILWQIPGCLIFQNSAFARPLLSRPTFPQPEFTSFPRHDGHVINPKRLSVFLLCPQNPGWGGGGLPKVTRDLQGECELHSELFHRSNPFF